MYDVKEGDYYEVVSSANAFYPSGILHIMQVDDDSYYVGRYDKYGELLSEEWLEAIEIENDIDAGWIQRCKPDWAVKTETPKTTEKVEAPAPDPTCRLCNKKEFVYHEPGYFVCTSCYSTFKSGEIAGLVKSAG